LRRGVKKIRILLAYGRDIIRKGLVTCLEEMPDVDLVAVCEYDGMVFQEAHRLKPDIVLLDGNIVGGDFREVIGQLRRELPEIRVILVTPLLRRYYDPLSYIDAKADGYIDLDIDAMRLSEALNSVYAGGNITCPLIADALLERALSADRNYAAEQPFVLTRRETEVLGLVARGQSNREIARALFVSENTIKAHLQSILRKIKVNTRTEAAMLAKEKGL
jgi:DNA-binding NarL/FixJ family response regulator